MRSKDYQSILDAIPEPTDLIATILGNFGPTIDDIVTFSNYSERTPANKPLLIGNNDYEAGLFQTELASTGTSFPDTFWDDFNLQKLTCPADIRANASVAAKNPTWRYHYFGIFPDLAISTEAGAWQGAELLILFGIFPLNPDLTLEEISIATYMRGAWAAFAKDPAKGLSTYGEGWPMYDASGETLIRLAYNNITGTNLALPSLYDPLCVYVNVSSTNTSAYSTIPTAVPTANWTGASSTDVGPVTASTSRTTRSRGMRSAEKSLALLLGGSRVFAAFFLL